MSECLHVAGACCWRCSDQVRWWKEARIKAGLGATPPNAPKPVEPAAPVMLKRGRGRPRINLTCQCGNKAVARGMCKSCYNHWYSKVSA
jgi:hypothetical protein